MNLLRLFSTVLVCSTYVLCQDLNKTLQTVVSADCRSNIQLNYDVDNYRKCIRAKTRAITDPQVDFEDTDEAVTEICRLDLAVCLRNLRQDIQNCTNNSSKLLSDAENSLASARSYLCDDDSQPLRDLLNDAFECFQDSEVIIELQKCLHLNQDFQQDWFLQNFNSNAICREQGNLARCVVNALDTCENKRAKTIITNLFYHALYATDCRKIIQKEYPDISSAQTLILTSFVLFPVFISVNYII